MSSRDSPSILCSLQNEQIGLGGPVSRHQYVTASNLETLFEDEWCFDHHLLWDLHLLIKKLVYKYRRVDAAVSEVIQRWSSEKIRNNDDEITCDSHVFLLVAIIPHVSNNERTMLEELVDDIRSYSRE